MISIVPYSLIFFISFSLGYNINSKRPKLKAKSEKRPMELALETMGSVPNLASTSTATKVVEIPEENDDDEIAILYKTPLSLKSGASKSEAISVEDYKISIDLTLDGDDDDVEVVPSFHFQGRKGKRFFKGESSKSSRRVVRLSFSCEICTEEKPISDAFLVSGCDHSYCTQCISNYVAAKLQDNITMVPCPVPGCVGRLEPPQCRTILPKQVFERWGDALCESMVLGAERFYCPYKDCSALLIHDDRGGDRLLESECPNCHRLFCVPCKAPWHAGIDCVEFQRLSADERSAEDIMLLNLAKSNRWRRCPQCHFYVSKSEGCLYMRCRCGHTFCYNCGATMNVHLHYCKACKH